jgi:hypothetical protein
MTTSRQANDARTERRRKKTAADAAYRSAQTQKRAARRKRQEALNPELRRTRNAKREQRRLEKAAADPAYFRKRAGRTRSGAPRRDAAPFVACDGQGIDQAPAKDARYALFRIGAAELTHSDNRRLTTPEILSFILDQPLGPNYIAYQFNYDVANILRDVEAGRTNPLVPSKLERLLKIDTQAVKGKPNPFLGVSWTWLAFEGYGVFGVIYLPGHHFKVCRARTPELAAGQDNYFARKAMPPYYPVAGTTRVIVDAIGFFNMPFLNALNAWGVGKAHWPGLKTMLSTAAAATEITPALKAYVALKCDLLAELMENFRKVCRAAELKPDKTWNGYGKIAAACHQRHGTMTTKRLVEIVPAHAIEMCQQSYYAGRSEINRIGRIKGPIWESDLNSAFAAAMVDLPCLEHGTWRRATAEQLKTAPKGALFVCPVRYEHPPSQVMCGHPHREKGAKGTLSWPQQGNGVYWSPELKSAERLGAKLWYRAGWIYDRQCDCKPFAWVGHLYDRRRALGPKSAHGLVIKGVLTALYGKLCQRVGNPTWRNPVWASLITATIRAKINDAIRKAGPRNVIMVATDALYTINKPPPVKLGEALGQWSQKRHAALFVVRPGLYWGPRPKGKTWLHKTRGLSEKFFERHVAAFEAAWDGYARGLFATEGGRAVDASPKVPVHYQAFIGPRYALRKGEPEATCTWIDVDQLFTFQWDHKRGADTWDTDDKRRRRHKILKPLAGAASQFSLMYSLAPREDNDNFWEFNRIEFEAMPDFVDRSIPFK